MALSASLAFGSVPYVLAGSATNFVVGITNTNATAVTVSSLVVSEATESDAQISQPVFITPNAPIGTGNAILPPGTTTYFPFQAIINSPYSSGPSPQQPGGASSQPAQTPDANFTLQATVQTSDGSVFFTSLLVASAATISNSPPALGGALQLTQGANLVNLLTTGL